MRVASPLVCAAALALACGPRPGVGDGSWVRQYEAAVVLPGLSSLDLLLVVDSSPGMREKQRLAADAAADVVLELGNPRCGALGAPVASAGLFDACS